MPAAAMARAGIRPSFVTSLDVRYSHIDSITGEPVLVVHAESILFGYVVVAADGEPVGIHDHRAVAA